MTGFALVPHFDAMDPSVPSGRTNSVILSSADEISSTRFLGEESLSDAGDYADLVVAAVAPVLPVAPPRSTLPSGAGALCSTFSAASGDCSTDANQTKCSVDASSKNCSSFDGGAGAGKCSTNSGSSTTKCSVHGGNDSHCSAGVGKNGKTAECSAFNKGFCSVFGGGGNPGGNGGDAGGQDNSCTAFGIVGKKPKCSAWVDGGIPLCSVEKGKANATCTVVDSEVYGKGAGTCSTLTKAGDPQPAGGSNLCSIIDLSENPPVVTPPVNGRCTTTKPKPEPPKGTIGRNGTVIK